MSKNMVADHAIRPVENDTIFTISAKASEATQKYGAENVINSSMGVLLEDNGDFVAFKSVYDYLKKLDNPKIAAYASIEGDKDFLQAVKQACFKEHIPNAYIEAVATPGGSGAIHHSIFNYTNIGDYVLTSSLYWDPYNTMCIENGRRLDTFNMFDKRGGLDIESFEDKFNYHLNRQNRLLTILNTPAHNPTGYSISDEEWDRIINILKAGAKNKDNKIILLVDVAYIDFCDEGFNRRNFMEKFAGLDENIIVLIAFSASKGYTMYGLRNGALLCVSSNEEIAKEFFYTSLHSNRGTWSNGTKCAMRVLTDIINDKNIGEPFYKERGHYVKMLRKRADAFLDSSKEEGLDLYPYKDGFFVCVPCKNPVKVSERLMDKNLFVIPLQTGLRFALCAVSEEKCKVAPKIIKEVMMECDE
ncbi:aminotransferase class I/II-fold pyridoxal phosphate-dependent enzyme [Anaerofustis sp.]|uniref:pyridoxal phosphate-dependent aminotransferase n=1 Tax=Anaerofustis sp. TaxID=1872517 RepID=UPI0025C50E2D|nr:aminotransferase class I/II-fold pyridoxal phosphate-dependent enzyme [Anaerofustis sp.]